jgi:hypothetical protein
MPCSRLGQIDNDVTTVHQQKRSGIAADSGHWSKAGQRHKIEIQPVRGLKLSRETSGAQPLAKLPRIVSGRVQGSSKPWTAPKPGPSTVKTNQVPQHAPDSELVLPPMPRRFFEELTTFPDDFYSSATESETSEDEVRVQGGLAKK